MSHLSDTQNQQGSGLIRLVRDYLPIFSISMLGLVAIRVWLQCCIYDRYTSTDSGLVTVVSNLFRVAVIAVFIVIALNRGFSATAQNRVGYISTVAMMLSAILFLVFSQTGQDLVLWAACICGGFGITWGGGMWICAYVRMHPGEALLYAFLSLAISSFLGFFLGILPVEVSYLIAVFMPPIAFIAFQRAQRILDEREKSGTTAIAQGVTDAGSDEVYRAEPRKTYVRLIAGIVLFNLALGIARGYPSGDSIALPVVFQAVHQFVVVLMSVLLLWWALGKGRSIKFSSLWNVSVALIAVGVLVLATQDAVVEPLGATLIAIANTFSIGLLWFSVYDMARHSNYQSYIILGVVWAAHILPRELGRFVIWEVGPQGEASVLLMGLIVFLLAGSMAFLLNDSIPQVRPFFEEFRKSSPSNTLRNRVVSMVNKRDEESSSETREDDTDVSSAVDALEGGLTTMQDRYRLTEREIEVLRYLAQGRSKIYIGKKLYISENTVKTYVKNIYTKLNIHNKQELLDCLEKVQDDSSLQ